MIGDRQRSSLGDGVPSVVDRVLRSLLFRLLTIGYSGPLYCTAIEEDVAANGGVVATDPLLLTLLERWLGT